MPTVVSAGQDLIVSSGQTYVGVIVLDQGIVTVSSGGITSAALISGGTENIESGGLAVGTIVGNYGQVDLYGGTARNLPVFGTVFGSVSGLTLSAGGVIDLPALAFSQSETVGFVQNGSNTQGVLTVTSGSQSFGITLLGQYVAAGFRIKDAAGATAITYAPPTSSAALAAGHH